MNKSRTMVIIYMMLYGKLQRFNWFQVALSRTLQQFGITERLRSCVIEEFRNDSTSTTSQICCKTSTAPHVSNLKSFFENAIEKKHFLVILIDDYHNIHNIHIVPTQQNKLKLLTLRTFMSRHSSSRHTQSSRAISSQQLSC